MEKYCISKVAKTRHITRGLQSLIVKKTGYSRVSVKRWMEIKEDDPQCIPSDALRIIASLFEVSMESLYSTPINMTTNEEA